MTPQMIYIILAAMSLGINLVRHGQDKEGKESFWVHLIAATITFSLLYWGGFFDVFLGE